MVWGEFGRTPKINKDAGRDHWPQVSCALLAGGGMKTGQVIGETNRLAEYADKRPVTFQEVFATLYHNIGIDLSEARVFDPNGRPQYPGRSGRRADEGADLIAAVRPETCTGCLGLPRGGASWPKNERPLTLFRTTTLRR